MTHLMSDYPIMPHHKQWFMLITRCYSVLRDNRFSHGQKVVCDTCVRRRRRIWLKHAIPEKSCSPNRYLKALSILEMQLHYDSSCLAPIMPAHLPASPSISPATIMRCIFRRGMDGECTILRMLTGLQRLITNLRLIVVKWLRTYIDCSCWI